MFRYTSFLFLLMAGMMAFTNAARPQGVQGLSNLAKRQQTGTIPDVPAQCKSTCDPVNTVVEGNSCTPSTCCVASFEMGYFNCFQCIFGLINFTDFTQPQSFVDLLIDDCAAVGIALPHLTFPGQNASRPLSSVASVRPTSATQSQISVPLSGITQSTVTSISLTPTSTFVQSTVSTIPTATSASSTPSPTGTSKGFMAADSRLGLGLSTIMLTACFYLAL